MLKENLCSDCEISLHERKKSPGLILWVLLRPISSILCPCPLPKFRLGKAPPVAHKKQEALERSEVFFESELLKNEGGVKIWK